MSAYIAGIPLNHCLSKNTINIIRILKSYITIECEIRISTVHILGAAQNTALHLLSSNKNVRSTLHILYLKEVNVGKSLIFLGTIFHILGPIYLRECLSKVTVLNLGITKLTWLSELTTKSRLHVQVDLANNS